MCIAIHNILTLARHAFKRRIGPDGKRKRLLESEEFLESLNEIAEVMKQLDVHELGLDQSPSLFPNRLYEHPSSYANADSEVVEDNEFDAQNYNERDNHPPELTSVPGEKPPVTYISVHEDPDFSISIFIMNGKARIPLHNHPDMHGLLQVVQGTLEVSCYNRVPLSDLSEDDLPEPLKNKQHLIEKGYIVPAENVVMKESKDKNSRPLILEPDKDNYHEIWNAGDEPAAFLDILAPPYTNEEEPMCIRRGPHTDTNSDDEIKHNDQRHCDFYKIARPMQTPVQRQCDDEPEKKYYWLQVVPTPSDYNCDFEPYTGPPLAT